MTTALTASEFWALVPSIGDLGILLGRDARGLSETLADLGMSIDPDRLATLLAANEALASDVDRSVHLGIELATPFDNAWPDYLSRTLGKTWVCRGCS